jgi:hypothetical protein
MRSVSGVLLHPITNVSCVTNAHVDPNLVSATFRGSQMAFAYTGTAAEHSVVAGGGETSCEAGIWEL